MFSSEIVVDVDVSADDDDTGDVFFVCGSLVIIREFVVDARDTNRRDLQPTLDRKSAVTASDRVRLRFVDVIDDVPFVSDDVADLMLRRRSALFDSFGGSSIETGAST